jgi:thymidylate synthase (FAD)
MSTGKGFKGWGPKSCRECKDGVYHDIEHQAFIQCPTCKGTGKVSGDEKLLRYLYQHRHTTPFEMAGMTIEIQAPIFIFRQWHRHRTQSYNEFSARYEVLPDMFYMPSVERLKESFQDQQNKQGSTTAPWDEGQLKWFQDQMAILYGSARYNYELFVKMGMASELARIITPVGQYSKMRASANLHNWLHFLTLRMDSHAQWEIRQYANEVGNIVAEKFPLTWELFAAR